MKLKLAVAITAIVLALALNSLGSSIQLKEDFTGSGEFQSNTDYYGVQDRALTRDAKSIVYGHIFKPNNCFSGFIVRGGDNSYSVLTNDHYLSIREAPWINATAKITSVQESSDNVTNATIPGSRFTLFSASGYGTVREMALTLGPKGRPIVLSGIRHRGPFKVNSSTSFEG